MCEFFKKQDKEGIKTILLEKARKSTRFYLSWSV